MEGLLLDQLVAQESKWAHNKLVLEYSGFDQEELVEENKQGSQLELESVLKVIQEHKLEALASFVLNCFSKFQSLSWSIHHSILK